MLILAVLLAVPMNAQRRDTSFSAEQLIAPGMLATFGLVTHYFAHDTWDYGIKTGLDSRLRSFPFLEDYFQYAPVAIHLGLGATGVPVRHGFWDRLIEAALAYTVCGVISIPAKYAFGTVRPNGNPLSFPSGHTCVSFTGAELVRMEYGPLWGAGAWGLAAGVGYLRVYHNYHWFSDILFGAAIGILSARAGGWLLDPVKNLLGINTSGNGDIAILPVFDPWTRSVSVSFGLNF